MVGSFFVGIAEVQRDLLSPLGPATADTTHILLPLSDEERQRRTEVG